MAAADRISLIILTPEKTILDKLVSKVELPGSKGRFMVLYNHESLISSLDEGQVMYESEGVQGRVSISDGFVEVHENKVIVCAEL